MSAIHWGKMITVLDHIFHNPGEWNQDLWACGTSACIAGRAVLQHYGNGLAILEATGVDIGLPGVNYHDMGKTILGLDDSQAHNLFYSVDSFTEVLDFLQPFAIEDGVEFPDEWWHTPIEGLHQKG